MQDIKKENIGEWHTLAGVAFSHAAIRERHTVQEVTLTQREANSFWSGTQVLCYCAKWRSSVALLHTVVKVAHSCRSDTWL